MKLDGDLLIQETSVINGTQCTVLTLDINILYSFTGTLVICSDSHLGEKNKLDKGVSNIMLIGVWVKVAQNQFAFLCKYGIFVNCISDGLWQHRF